jgi:hypothetical protein
VAFKRVIEVVVGPKNGTGFSIKDLRIEFSIEKSDSREPNKGTVKIYNISNDTHEKVIIADNHISLKAGYEDETVATICFGDVLRGYRERDGLNRVTVLEIYDSRIALMSGNVSVSYAKGTSALTIAQGFLDAIGKPYKGTENIPAGAKYEHGFPFIGMATDGLKDVLNRYGLTYTVQNEMVYILKPGQPAETVGLELTPKSGLLTTPQAVSDKTDEGDVKAEPSGRWKFSTMLFPELVPGVACVVRSSTLDGTAKISKGLYHGDNWTGEFQIDIEALEL